MKKLIASLTILATGAALASSVSSSATFGVLKITSTAKETAISVPWISAGTSGETILVKDFVKTSNLTGYDVATADDLEKADRLLVYNNESGAYKCWYLNNSKVWTGTGSSYNGLSVGAGSDEDTLKRGDALILIRTSTSLSASDHAIYLYGQYNSATPTYSLARDEEKVKCSLFAPVNSSGNVIYLNLQDAVDSLSESAAGSKALYLEWTNPQNGDFIKLQRASGATPTFIYDSTQTDYEWGVKENGVWIHAPAQMGPGMGAWYTAGVGKSKPSFVVKTYTKPE